MDRELRFEDFSGYETEDHIAGDSKYHIKLIMYTNACEASVRYVVIQKGLHCGQFRNLCDAINRYNNLLY